MEPTTLVIAGVAALAILMITVGVANSGSGAAINARLERYAAGKDEAVKPGGQQNLGEMISGSEALASFNKVVEQRNFGANLARELARADLRLKVSEYLMIWAGSIIGVPAAFLLLSFVIQPLGNPIALLALVLF